MPAHLVESIGSGPGHVTFVHGILGSGRNWRSFARKLAADRPDLTLHLVDQRAHGKAPPSPPPHTLAACAADLEELIRPLGPVRAVVGHSFGGKVSLCWARDHGGAPVWVLDAPPGLPEGEPTVENHDVMGVLAGIAALPMPAASRQSVRAVLQARGLSEPLVAWLLTSLRREGDGWRWVYDLPAVHALLDDYFRTDLWPFARGPHPVHLVMAERSDRWSDDDLDQAEAADASGELGWHVVADAGHWLHVDNPDALRALLAEGL